MPVLCSRQEISQGQLLSSAIGVVRPEVDRGRGRIPSNGATMTPAAFAQTHPCNGLISGCRAVINETQSFDNLASVCVPLAGRLALARRGVRFRRRGLLCCRRHGPSASAEPGRVRPGRVGRTAVGGARLPVVRSSWWVVSSGRSALLMGIETLFVLQIVILA